MALNLLLIHIGSTYKRLSICTEVVMLVAAVRMTLALIVIALMPYVLTLMTITTLWIDERFENTIRNNS
jgi:hypothetical protein